MIGTIQLDIRYVATTAAAAAFGRDLPRLARAVVRRLARRGGFGVAHLQFRTRGRLLAVSARLAKSGVVWLELDVGDPSLPAILVTEEEYARAEDRAYGRPPRRMRR